MAKFILNDDGSFTQEKKKKKQTSKYEELKNVPFTGQSKFKNQTSGTYFKKSEGNTGQAIGYSALDALGNFTEGSLNFFEGMSDSARYAGANVLDFFGADKKAKEIRERARENDVEDIVNQWNHITAGDLSGTKSEKEIGRFKKVEDNSIFGEKSDQVIQGVGNSLTGAAVGSYLGAPITGVGKGANLARNVIGLTSFGSSAAGHATTEAYNEGANDFQAGVYGILSGAVESGSEMLFGGLGKINKSLGFGTGALDDVIVKKLTKNIGNTLFRNIATIGLKSAGEGVEEIASLLGEQLVRRMMNMDSKTLKELAEDGTLADTFVQGTLSSLISQTPSGISSTVQGRDYTTGLTRTQQQYVNEIAQQRMVEAQRRNARLNGMQKSQIEDRALTDYQKGRLVDASKLEKVNLPGISTKDMDLQQSAYKYGINPNSEAIVGMKTLFDNRDIVGIFDADRFKGSNENAFWSRNENGKREVVLNPNASPDVLLEEIAIHELTHDLMSSENSQEIIDNQKIMDYVSTLDGYEEARAKAEKLYAKQTKGKTAEAKKAYIDEEIVADTLGKNIGSQEYIRRLIDDEPSIAKNIYDWVVNKVANKNGVKNEKAYWNNVKNNFEKAYNMEYQVKGNKKNTKLALSETALNEVASVATETAEQAKNNPNQFVKLKEHTIKTLVDYGIEDLPMLARRGHVRENVLTAEQANKLGYSTKNKHFHSLGVKTYLEIIDSMDEPIAVYQYTEKGKYNANNFIVLTPIEVDGKQAIVPIEINNNPGQYNRIEIDYNKIKTAYFKDNNNYIQNMLKEGKIKEIFAGSNSQKTSLVANNVTQSKDNVKSDEKYSVSKQLENQASNLVEEDIQTRNAMLDNFKSYLEEYDITNPTQEDIDNSLIDLLSYDNDMTPAETLKYEKQYKEVVNEYLKEQKTTTDNQGRELTKEQQEFFKDSTIKVVEGKYGMPEINENGKLFEVYHGTNNDDFTVFDENYIGSSNDSGWYGKGFYFAFTEGEAKTYGSNVLKAYLNIKKPFDFSGEMQSYDGVTSGDVNFDLGSFIVNLKNKFPEIANKETLRWWEYDSATGEDEARNVTFTELGNKIEDLYNSKDLSIVEINDMGRTKYQYAYGQNLMEYNMPNQVREIIKKTRIFNKSDLNFDLKYPEHSLATDSEREILKEFYEQNDVNFTRDLFGYPTENKEMLEKSRLSEATYYVVDKMYRHLDRHMPEYYMQYMGDDIRKELIKQGYDGVIQSKYGDEIVAFYPNQIKRVDNTNPTEDADIRKSQQTEGWQSFLDKNFEAKGTKTRLSDIKLPGLTKAVQEEVQKQTSNALLPIANELKELNKNLTKVMNPSEIAQLTPQDANTTPILPGINRNKVGDGKSKFFDNINEKTNMLNDEQKTAILSNDDVKYYDKVTNKDSLDKAFERLQNGGMHEAERWFNKDAENADATDVAEGWILLKQYADSGDTDGMVEVAKQMRKIGTKAGQTVQAFNIMSRLTPEGMVKYAQSELLEAYDQMVKNKSKAWIDANRDKFDLKPNEVAFIMDTMKDVSTMEDGYDKRFKLAQIQKVLTDKLPPAKGAGMKAWMRISMLFNPKTQVRNVAGNALIAPVNAFGDMFASLADKAIGSKTGVRTTGNFNLKDYTSGMKKGLYESYNDFKHGVNTRNVQGNRFEVTEGKSFNDNNAIGKALNKVDNLLSFVLDAGDRGFYEAAFVNSINNQMVLNNTTEVTQGMIDIATQEALSRTWQDNNEYTKFVMNMRNELNRFVHVNGYGLGDILIPFAKTPANLTKAIVDYSPVGLVSALNKGIKLNRSLTNGQYNAQTQHEFVQSLGKATAGTILYVLGYALAQAGITSGASDEDKDVSNFLKNTLGVNSYSIKIGNKTFTYDWAQPIAAPLSMMANMVQKQKEGATLAENITTTLDTGLNLLFEQSFLESLSNVLSQPGEIGTKMIDQFLDLPSRAVPTLFKQIADLVDGTQRQTYVKDKPVESMINEVKAKIPGLSQTLAPSVDTLGREIQKYGGKNNLFNVFLNPANVSTENVSESGQEIYRLYKETGETNIMPRVAPYYVNKKGEKIILSTKQRTQYQKVSGSIIENNVANLLESTTYKNMSDTKKAEVISDIVNYSYNIAQMETLGTELSDTYEKAYEYSQIGEISDYYEFRNSIDDKNAETKRESVFNYLYNSDLEDNQIAKLYRGCNYSSDKTLDAMLNLRIPMKQFIKFDTTDIQGKYNSATGKTINGSKKNATIEFVNTLNLSKAQKAILIKDAYNTYDRYNNDIIRYVNTLNGSVDEKKVWLKSIGFDIYDKDVVRYIKSQGLSQEETEKKLEELGFTIRDGRVYY